MVRSPDSNTDVVDIVTGVLQGDTLAALYLFKLYLDYVFWTSIDLIKEIGFTLKKTRCRRYPTETMIYQDYAEVLALLANTIA